MNYTFIIVYLYCAFVPPFPTVGEEGHDGSGNKFVGPKTPSSTRCEESLRWLETTSVRWSPPHLWSITYANRRGNDIPNPGVVANSGRAHVPILSVTVLIKCSVLSTFLLAVSFSVDAHINPSWGTQEPRPPFTWHRLSHCDTSPLPVCHLCIICLGFSIFTLFKSVFHWLILDIQ